MNRKPIDEIELLEKTVNEYLEAFNAHEKFTPENVINAFYYFYRDINISSLFFENDPENDYIISSDDLYITITSQFYNYYFMSAKRGFHFSGAEETIWFGYKMYFEEMETDENIAAAARLDKMKKGDYDNELNEFLKNPHYLKIKDQIPTKIELYVNYDV
jgi:hypothetical protein